MKKIITTLTAVTFALGLAAAAQAQVAKTPEKPAVQSTQTTVQPQAAPKEAAKPVAQETVKPGDKTKEAVTTGEKSPKVTKSVDQGKVKKDAKKVASKDKIEKKAGAPVDKTQEGAK